MYMCFSWFFCILERQTSNFHKNHFCALRYMLSGDLDRQQHILTHTHRIQNRITFLTLFSPLLILLRFGFIFCWMKISQLAHTTIQCLFSEQIKKDEKQKTDLLSFHFGLRANIIHKVAYKVFEFGHFYCICHTVLMIFSSTTNREFRKRNKKRRRKTRRASINTLKQKDRDKKFYTTVRYTLLFCLHSRYSMNLYLF